MIKFAVSQQTFCWNKGAEILCGDNKYLLITIYLHIVLYNLIVHIILYCSGGHKFNTYSQNILIYSYCPITCLTPQSILDLQLLQLVYSLDSMDICCTVMPLLLLSVPFSFNSDNNLGPTNILYSKFTCLCFRFPNVFSYQAFS